MIHRDPLNIILMLQNSTNDDSSKVYYVEQLYIYNIRSIYSYKIPAATFLDHSQVKRHGSVSFWICVY
jgi:hypothetical protein